MNSNNDSKEHSNRRVAQLRRWIGRKETKTDTVTAWPVAALAATLDRDDPLPKHGDELPPGWHWLYFLETTATSDLGADGHTKRGGFLPPVLLPRRMSAGGRLEFRRPLKIGDSIRRDSEIVSMESKQGKSGELVFVTVRHTVSAESEVAVVEEHDIVYRGAAKPGEPAPPGRPASGTAQWHRSLIGDPVLLFRYSALIFMAHRIHYDLDYVRHEEHYPGLIVHGPLQTTLLLDLCRRYETRCVKQLHYRAVHPVFHTERFTVNGNLVHDGSSAELWIANAAGNYAMVGTAMF